MLREWHVLRHSDAFVQPAARGGGVGGAPHKKRPETGTGQSSLCDGFGTDMAQAGIGSGSDTDAIRGTVLPGERIVTAC